MLLLASSDLVRLKLAQVEGNTRAGDIRSLSVAVHHNHGARGGVQVDGEAVDLRPPAVGNTTHQRDVEFLHAMRAGRAVKRLGKSRNLLRTKSNADKALCNARDHPEVGLVTTGMGEDEPTADSPSKTR